MRSSVFAFSRLIDRSPAEIAFESWLAQCSPTQQWLLCHLSARSASLRFAQQRMQSNEAPLRSILNIFHTSAPVSLCRVLDSPHVWSDLVIDDPARRLLHMWGDIRPFRLYMPRAIASPPNLHMSSRRWIEKTQLLLFPPFDLSALSGIDVRPWRLRQGNNALTASGDSELFYHSPRLCLSLIPYFSNWPASYLCQLQLFQSWCPSPQRDTAFVSQHVLPGLLENTWRLLGGSSTAFCQIPSQDRLLSDSGKLRMLDVLLTRLKVEGHRGMDFCDLFL
jgi:hypothetical protein